jgi:tryptophan 2,3-dioxygenase
MPEARISFDGRCYKSKLRATDQRVLSKLESQSSLADRVETWLLRTPFVVWKDWDFEDAYSRAVETMFANERHMISENPELDQEQRDRQLRNVEQSEDVFRSILQPVDGTVAAPGWRFRPQALLAALFINLYRDEPALQLPYRLLTVLMDIDELLSTWRHRHALMVQRMIGRKIGTGGSSGHDYLKSSAEKHRIFGDLFALATFLIPRSALPPLPPRVQRAMRYQYTDTAS